MMSKCDVIKKSYKYEEAHYDALVHRLNLIQEGVQPFFAFLQSVVAFSRYVGVWEGIKGMRKLFVIKETFIKCANCNSKHLL